VLLSGLVEVLSLPLMPVVPLLKVAVIRFSFRGLEVFSVLLHPNNDNIDQQY